MRNRPILVIATLLLLSLASSYLSAASIWVEGEDASSNAFKTHSWYDSVKKDTLSGGEWISHFNKDAPAQATWNVEVADAGRYLLWIRLNPIAGAQYHYKINESDWVDFDCTESLRGQINIAADDKHDMRAIAWSRVGKVALPAGVVKFSIKTSSKNLFHGAIDCMVFSNDGFIPSGLTKPGVVAGVSQSVRPADVKDAIWIEGEDADSRTTKHHSWYGGVTSDALSGGVLVDHWSAGEGETAYKFNIVEADAFTLWARINPFDSEMSYAIDKGALQKIDVSTQRDKLNIATGGAHDMRYLAWVKIGKIKLSAGSHSIRFRFMHSNPERNNHGYLDCFTFVRVPFIPSGTSRPSIQVAGSIAADTWFPVIGDDDEYSSDSVIDMSHLIEVPAGKHGFLTTAGEDLRFKNDATPRKFWAVGANTPKDSKKSAQKIAKWYRKHGVNLVRQHTMVGAVGLPDANGKFDKVKLDNYDRWFAACKEQGIYTTWSVICPHHKAMLQKGNVSDALYNELLKNDKSSRNGVVKVNDFINVNRELQDWTLSIFKELLNHKNPYTGLAYKDDPALAVVEAQNESCVFWHSIKDLQENKLPIMAKELRQKFFTAMKKKYGSKSKLKSAWDGKLVKGDNWAKGELALMAAYHWGADGPTYDFAGATQRAGDFLEFLYDIQAAYYKRRKIEIKEIGFKGVYVTTAWQGPGSSVLPNLKADTEGDLIDRHNYFGGGDGGHEIKTGAVSNTSHLLHPGSGLLNLGMYQVENTPFAVSEWSLMPPSPVKAEAAPLMAFYGMGLQGWDIIYHFGTGDIARMGDGWHGNRKYVTHTPHYMGQFPAVTFALYNGHIKEGDIVAARQASDAEVFSGKDSLGMSTSGYDIKVMGKGKTPNAALAVGKVTLGFSGEKENLKNISSYWDQSKKTVHSTTGQLSWDYGQQVVLLKGEKTQAIIGYAGGSSYDLPGVKVKVETPFISLIFTPLDNEKLKVSKRILVTAMARDKQTGAEFNADWSQLLKRGVPPLLMEPVQATITLKGAKPSSVRACDIYGIPKGKSLKIGSKGRFSISGKQAAYYYYIER